MSGAPMTASSATPPGDDFALPALRQDLRLIEGLANGSGSNAWKIHDPLAQRYFEIEQQAVDLLACWGAGTVGSLRHEVQARSGRMPSAQSVAALLQFLERHELLAPQPQATFRRVRERAAAAKPTLWNWALHNYLFVRVPLVRPDRFLRSTLPWMRWGFHPEFWLFAAVAALTGLYLVSRQWEAFLNTFPEMFDAAGIATYGLSLVLVKTLHELGHGYAAVRLGSRVPTMGVAFIVMTPVLYTDTTDAWRLPARRQRVQIDAAGMAVELLVATIATLAWVFVPDGAVRNAAFALATTGWVMSLAVNLNPLMRFDGYYLFSDLVGIPNLQERAFAMGRWFTRELLFGYGDRQPEPADARRRVFFVAFAWAVWVYRFFLFLGIAVLVYHYFFKALGIFLFAVEIGWFIVRPIWNEIRVWIKRRVEAGRRTMVTVAVALALLAVFVTPWRHTLRIPAVLTAAHQAPAFAPRPARIEEILFTAGQRVKANDVLMRLSAPEIDDALDRSREKVRGIEERLARRVSDARDLSQSLVLARDLQLERDRIGGLARERERLVVRAPIDGVVIDFARELHPGRWIDAKTQLLLVAQPTALEARGYLDGQDLERIAKGWPGRFLDDARLMPELEVEVHRVAAAASDSLDTWLLASVAGGTVPSRRDSNKLKPEYAAFEIVAAVESPAGVSPLTEVRGELQVEGVAQSLVERALRRLMQVLIREGAA